MNTLKQFTLIAVLFTLMFQASTAFASEENTENDAMEKALATLKEQLTGISEDLFLREQKLENGMIIYQLMWEMGGETSKITLELRPLGQYDHKPVFGLFAYTLVEGVDSGSLPPAVIKAVATRNETTMLGYFSMPKTFDSVYMNMTTPSDNLTSAQLWMICAWLHKSRVEFKTEIESILKATG